MTTQLYVDETKARGYQVVAAVGVHADLQVPRKEISSFRLPGQRSVHMQSERDQRRRELADMIGRMSIRATVYDAGRRYRTEKEARAACLQALITDAACLGEARITLHLDESLLQWDRQRLIEYTRAAGVKDQLTYTHATMSAELLLSIPDAIAWCWAKGGDWRRRIEPIISEVREL